MYVSVSIYPYMSSPLFKVKCSWQLGLTGVTWATPAVQSRRTSHANTSTPALPACYSSQFPGLRRTTRHSHRLSTCNPPRKQHSLKNPQYHTSPSPLRKTNTMVRTYQPRPCSGSFPCTTRTPNGTGPKPNRPRLSTSTPLPTSAQRPQTCKRANITYRDDDTRI